MRAGKLDKMIEVIRSTTGVDDYGTPSNTWQTIYNPIRAQIVQGSAEEFMRSFGTSSETAMVFRIRHLQDLTLGDVVVYDGRSFDVKEIKEIGRKQGLELRCISVGMGV